MNNNINKINLVFPKTITRLAYYPYGQEIYKKQVEPNIDFTDDVTHIVFPDHIVKAASSFVQGFFKEIIENLGYDAIGKKIIIDSKNQSLIDSITENLLF